MFLCIMSLSALYFKNIFSVCRIIRKVFDWLLRFYQRSAKRQVRWKGLHWGVSASISFYICVPDSTFTSSTLRTGSCQGVNLLFLWCACSRITSKNSLKGQWRWYRKPHFPADFHLPECSKHSFCRSRPPSACGGRQLSCWSIPGLECWCWWHYFREVQMDDGRSDACFRFWRCF